MTVPLEPDDLVHALAAAQSDDCKLWLARRLVQARWERGDYVMLQELSADIREALAIALIKEICK